MYVMLQRQSVGVVQIADLLSVPDTAALANSLVKPCGQPLVSAAIPIYSQTWPWWVQTVGFALRVTALNAFVEQKVFIVIARYVIVVEI